MPRDQLDNAVFLFLSKRRYSAGKNLLNDMECQRKAICEIYQDESNEFGEFGRRAKHSLDFVDSVQYLNVPDEVLNLADEYAVRKTFCSKILYRYYFRMLNNRKLHWFIFFAQTMEKD